MVAPVAVAESQRLGPDAPARVVAETIPPDDVAVPVASFSEEGRDLFDYYNRILVRAGKDPISKDATIVKQDVEAFLQMTKDSQERVWAKESTWRSAVNVHSMAATKEIDEALRQGRKPTYSVLPDSVGMPRVKQPYDMVSIHRPAGSVERYLIELPEQLCPKEAQAFREARESQAVFFDETLRPLFRNPSSREK